MADAVLASELLQAHMKAHVDLRAEVSVLNVEVKRLHEEIRELREDQKELLQFMYSMQGGKKALFGLLTVAASLGTVLGSFLTHFVMK